MQREKNKGSDSQKIKRAESSYLGKRGLVERAEGKKVNSCAEEHKLITLLRRESAQWAVDTNKRLNKEMSRCQKKGKGEENNSEKWGT